MQNMYLHKFSKINHEKMCYNGIGWNLTKSSWSMYFSIASDVFKYSCTIFATPFFSSFCSTSNMVFHVTSEHSVLSHSFSICSNFSPEVSELCFKMSRKLPSTRSSLPISFHDADIFLNRYHVSFSATSGMCLW